VLLSEGDENALLEEVGGHAAAGVGNGELNGAGVLDELDADDDGPVGREFLRRT
jgi:hypothetical protein